MDRRIFNGTGVGLLAGFFGLMAGAARPAQAAEAGPARLSGGKPHRVAIQVSSEDHKVQEQALGNAHNYARYYQDKGEPFMIEIVAFGAGYNMMRNDVSMVKGDIEDLSRELGTSIVFAACQNTRRAIAESMGQKPEQVAQIKGVVDAPSGVVRLAELQEQGWSYIRP